MVSRFGRAFSEDFDSTFLVDSFAGKTFTEKFLLESREVSESYSDCAVETSFPNRASASN